MLTTNSSSSSAVVESDIDQGARALTDHNYNGSSRSTTCSRECSDQIKGLELEMATLKFETEQLSTELKELKQSPFCIDDIKENDEKMLLYTSIPYDVFDILVKPYNVLIFRIVLDGECIYGLSLENQLLSTLMRLNMGCKDLDKALRFNNNISRASVSNIFNTFIHVLHELRVDNFLLEPMPSQRKCKGSMPKSFEGSAAQELLQ